MREPNYSILAKLSHPSKHRKDLENLTGQKFGHLTVFGYVGSRGVPFWLCRCDCGGWIITRAGSLKSGRSKTCRCYMDSERSVGKGNFRTHGLSRTNTYGRWLNLRTRCNNPNCKDYPHWGGRGITVCQGFDDYLRFLRLLGDPPDRSYDLDRKDNHGNYSCGECEECLSKNWPMNVRWVTDTESRRNMTRNIMLTANNETHCISEWTEIRDISYTRLYQRITKLKWTPEEALDFAPPPVKSKKSG